MKSYEVTTSVKLGDLRRSMIKKIAKKRKVTPHRVILDAVDGIIALEIQRWQQSAENRRRK